MIILKFLGILVLGYIFTFIALVVTYPVPKSDSDFWWVFAPTYILFVVVLTYFFIL